jgi:hypothetical protein
LVCHEYFVTRWCNPTASTQSDWKDVVIIASQEQVRSWKLRVKEAVVSRGHSNNLKSYEGLNNLCFQRMKS